ncbi:MAG: hypothetical protein AAGC97_05440 [Planctomycetota bacterium]
MKLVRLVAIWLSLLAVETSVEAALVRIDDFSDPANGSQNAAQGDPRADFPVGTSGGSIMSLGGGTDIALDRGLFGESGQVSVSGGLLQFSFDAGIVSIDWDLDGFQFFNSGVPAIRLEGLTNTGGQTVSLSVQMFQLFNNGSNSVGSATQQFDLAGGASRDLFFTPINTETDFVGFRFVNSSPGVTFTGSLASVSAIPEPAAGLMTALTAVAWCCSRRRRIFGRVLS